MNPKQSVRAEEKENSSININNNVGIDIFDIGIDSSTSATQEVEKSDVVENTHRIERNHTAVPASRLRPRFPNSAQSDICAVTSSSRTSFAFPPITARTYKPQPFRLLHLPATHWPVCLFCRLDTVVFVPTVLPACPSTRSPSCDSVTINVFHESHRLLSPLVLLLCK